MKKFLAILIFTMGVAAATTPSSFAQNVATYERVPKLKLHNWLNGHIPVGSDYTYLGFIHSASVPCIESTSHVISTAKQVGMSVIIFTKESQASLGKWLYKVTDEPCVGVHHSSSNIFTNFGVKYAPFGIIISKKRRALWFGNPNRLTQKDIINIIDNNKKNNKKRCRSRK
ncbi:MAG: hypothetical protein IIV10_01775 [Alistipes sp.]|nr:hypothetical protein [Alistipes sp.]